MRRPTGNDQANRTISRSSSLANSVEHPPLNPFSPAAVNAAMNAVASGDNEQENIARALVAETLQRQMEQSSFPPRGVAVAGGPRDYDDVAATRPVSVMSSSTSISSSTNQQTLTSCSDKDQGEEGGVASQGEIMRTRRRTRVEGFVRCSESHLWTLMMNFYERKGVDSWSKGIVPHFITSNAFIGQVYAKILRGFIADATRERSPVPDKMRIDTSKKLYIIELGAGSGKFSFFLLKALQEMRAVLDFPFDNIVYVMTDFTGSYYKFWREHPALRPYIDTGQLDFAIFDAVNGSAIKLVNSNVLLCKDNPTANPICVVANYLFDTLCNDIFQIDDGQLKEGLMAVGSSRPSEPDPNDPEIISHLSNEYIYRPTTCDYYSNESVTEDHIHFERILEWYKDSFSHEDSAQQGASILVPLGAIRAIRRLSDCANGRAFLISGDKGNSNPYLFRGLKDPHIALHGSFSMMVNYHGIGSYVTSRGGFALYNTQDDSSLQVSCFVLLGDNDIPDDVGVDPFLADGFMSLDRERKRQFPALVQAYDEYINSFSPNDFFVLQSCLKEEAEPSLKSIVSLLKLSHWDSDVFFKYRDSILSQVPDATVKVINDLSRGMPKVWDNYFMLDDSKDIAFEIGRFYYGVHRYSDALAYYEISTETVGQHHVTFHNMGLCHYSLKNIKNALFYFELSLEMNKSYEKALSWLNKVSEEISPVISKEAKRIN